MKLHTSFFKAIFTFLALFAWLAAASRSTAKGTGVSGWCDFTWSNTHKVTNVQCGATDTKGDSHPVFSELYLYCDNGLHCVEKVLGRYDMKKGHGKTDWDDTKHSWDSLPRGNMFKARTKACVNVQLGKDKCFWGNVVDNPYTAG